MSSPKSTKPNPRRVAAATLIGTTIEWYDFYLYGVAAALIFGPQFFPDLSPLVGTLASFGTFAVGFIARPLGALLFGHYGDRIGRKSVLLVSLLMTGTGTFVIGLLPTFDAIGILAPILLVALRMIQGIGVGGEWTGAVLMAGEHAPADKKGEYAGWPQLGSGLGLLTANGIFLLSQMILGPDAFTSWGWRIPFVLSAAMVFIGLYIRLRVQESPEFASARSTGQLSRNPLREALVSHPATILLVAGVFCFNNAAFFVVTVFGLSFLRDSVGVSSETGLGAVLAGSVVLLACTYFLSWLSDRINASRIIITMYILWIPFVFGLLALLATGSTPLIYLGMIVGVAMTSFYGPLAGFLQRQFPIRLRYSGLGIAVQIGAIFGGGLGPLAATQLNASFGPGGVGVYLSVVSLIGIACTLALVARSTRHERSQTKSTVSGEEVRPS